MESSHPVIMKLTRELEIGMNMKNLIPLITAILTLQVTMGYIQESTTPVIGTLVVMITYCGAIREESGHRDLIEWLVPLRVDNLRMPITHKSENF